MYLCGETFAESVQLSESQVVYGALDCAGDWAYVPSKKSEIAPAAGSVALIVAPQVSATIEDVWLHAADASEPGGSSIAMIASTDSTVELTRCDVEAGNGRDGAAGAAFGMSATAGLMGNNGTDACGAAITVGGGSVVNECEAADPNDDSTSGAGGVGQSAAGGDAQRVNRWAPPTVVQGSWRRLVRPARPGMWAPAAHLDPVHKGRA